MTNILAQSVFRLILLFLCLFMTQNGIGQTGVFGQYNATLVKRITALLDNLLIDYDSKFRPQNGKEPLEVTVHISVLNIGPVSEKDMEITMDCYFRQIWQDERLKYDKNDTGIDDLPLASKVLKDIWRPDTYVRNGRQSYLHTLTVPNILLRVSWEGVVYVSQRRDLVYKWKAVQVNPKIDLSQYKIIRHSKTEENISDPKNANDPRLSTLKAYFVLERQQGFYILQIYTPCTLIVVMSWVSFWINKEASPARVGLGIMTVLTMSTLGLGGRDDLPKVSYSTALDIYIVACFGFVFMSLVEYAVVNYTHMIYMRRLRAQRNQEIRDFRTAKLIREMSMLTATLMTATTEPSTGTAGRNNDVAAAGENNDILLTRLDDSVVTGNTMTTGAKVGLVGGEQYYCSNNRRLMPSKRRFYHIIATKAKQKLTVTPEHPGMMVDRIDTAAKFLFPGLYALFNVIYWLAFLYWIPDEIDV